MLGRLLFANCEYQNYSNFIKPFEGFSSSVYFCSQGKRTVGWGTNLEFKNVSYVVGQEINLDLINLWFNQDVALAVDDCHKLYPSFDSHPESVRLILVDLRYNLGLTGLRKFERFNLAINKRDYLLAAKELEDSRYFRQTGLRARNHVESLKNKNETFNLYNFSKTTTNRGMGCSL